MKAEMNCMLAMSTSSEAGPDCTLDNIERKHSEKLTVFKDDKVENDNTKEPIALDSTTQSCVVDIGSNTCNLACVNEDDNDTEDCSCTTTGSRSPTPVHFEITAKGVKVISDRESFL